MARTLSVQEDLRHLSQSLFSWIHLSHNTKGGTYDEYFEAVSILIFLDPSFSWLFNITVEYHENGLNPYFPGSIFLMTLRIASVGTTD